MPSNREYTYKPYGPVNLEEVKAGQVDYTTVLTDLAISLYNGNITDASFFSAMASAIQSGLKIAWEDGAAAAGILPDEITVNERAQLGAAIGNEISHLISLVFWIKANNAASGGIVESIISRMLTWGYRWLDIFNQALLAAQNNPKLKWVYDPTKEHCATCSKLDGKVKRASYWNERGLRPQNPPNSQLSCGGWRCGCELVPTNERLSPGPLPKTP